MTAISLLGILGLIGFLTIGLAVGAAYFTAMWRSAELFAAGRRMPLAIALVAGRFALIAATLAGVAIRGGAMPLLMTALGVVIARAVAVRRVRAIAP
jgi:hypothetical protein